MRAAGWAFDQGVVPRGIQALRAAESGAVPVAAGAAVGVGVESAGALAC